MRFSFAKEAWLEGAAYISPVGEFPVGWIVKRPVAAPNNLDARRGGYFLADMPDKVPLLPRKVPCFRAMHDINGKAVIMGGLPRLRLAQTLNKQPRLLLIVAIDAMREHWHAEFCETLN